MDFSSGEELLVTASVADQEEKRGRREKRLRVHDVNARRETGTEDRIHYLQSFFRMSRNLLNTSE